MKTTNIRPHRRSSRALRLAAAALSIVATAVPLAATLPAPAVSAAGPEPVFTMYVPFKERDLLSALKGMITGGYGDVITTTIGVTAAANDTVLYYDHWEDGFEADIADPQQATTEVWGDADASNGAPPGCGADACDRFDAGDVATLISNVPVPRVPADVFYDGGDKIAASRGVAVTRAGWDATKGTVHGGAIATTDLSKYGTRFSVPVGVDYRHTGSSVPEFPNANYTSNNNDAFEYVAATIMASRDNTIVQVDRNADGIWDDFTVLNEGESYFTAPDSYTPFDGLRTGARIQTNFPVQAHLITGDINHANESRWFELFPDELLDSRYIAPVNTTVTARPVHVLVHNPNSFPLDIDFDASTTAWDTTITVPAGQTRDYLLNSSAGAVQVSSNDGRFAAISGVDMFSSSSGSYDWGYSLVPVQALTPGVVIGWAPGMSSPRSTTYSPVWVSPLAATDIYVDFDGDEVVDHVFSNVQPMEVVQVADTINYKTAGAFPGSTNDHDMTGARIWSPSGVLIAAAYGQDTSFASATIPYDLGITVLPATTLVVTKTADLVVDADSNGNITPGDTIEYTIKLIDAGALALTDVYGDDPLPAELHYVANSSYHNGVPVPDDNVGPTRFPFDDNGITTSTGTIEPGGVETYVYRTIVDPNLTPAGDNIRNTVYATSLQASGTATANINVWFPDLYVTKTTSTPGPVLPGETFDWIVSVTNTGSSPQTDVTISDTLPANIELNSATIDFAEPDLVNSVDVTETWDASVYNADPSIWSGNWVESDGAQNPGAGDVRIVTDLGSPRVELRRAAGSGSSQRWIQRTIDASAAVSGIVSFDYRPVSLDNTSDIAAFQVSTDGGASWETLDVWYGFLDEGSYIGAQYNIDRFAGESSLTFRFWTNFGGTGTADAFYVDNFQVVLPARSSNAHPLDVNAGPNWTDGFDIDLFEDESVVLTFNVTVDSPLPADVFVLPNTATATSAEVPDPQTATYDMAVKPVRVGGHIWHDLDGDGVADAGEPNTGGAHVRLHGFDDLSNPVDLTVTTNAVGVYLFDGLAPGDYTVELTGTPSPLTLWRDIDGVHDGVIDIDPADWGDDFLGGDFALTAPAEVTGVVFRDIDSDASLDPTDFGLAGIDVTLAGADALGTPVEVTTTTGSGGSYSFEDLDPGSYTVSPAAAQVPAPSSATTATSAPLTVMSAGSYQADFGFDIDTAVQATKTLNGTTGLVAQGGTATFTITVTNPGPGELTAVTVTDAATPDCDRVFSSIAAGASETYSCSAADVDSDWVDWTNTVTVDASDEFGGTVAASDSADVTMMDPQLDVTVTPTQTVVVNGTATFTVRVTNTGDVDITGILVAASSADCDTSIAVLEPSTWDEYTCSQADVTADFSNIVVALGDDPNGHPVSDVASGTVTVLTPALDVSISPATQLVVTGGDATFTVRVTNTGETMVTGIDVTVDGASDCDRTAIDLNVDAHSEWSCAATGLTADLTVEVAATGDDPLDNPVTATPMFADVDVFAPGLTLTITPDATTVPLYPLDGHTVEVTVANTGDVDLDDVHVTTSLGVSCTADIATLAADDDFTFTCLLDGLMPDLTVTGAATGDDPLDNPVSDTDSATISADPAGITVTKTVVGSSDVGYGQPVTFEITVETTSTSPLLDVEVTDTLIPACNRMFATFAGNHSETWTCGTASAVGDFTNTVVATANDYAAGLHAATDSAPVNVLAPSVSVTKTATAAHVDFGGTAVWEITVTNTGEADLVDVDVVDAVEPSCARTIALLPAGAGLLSSVTWTCETTYVTADVTNTATVSADDTYDNTVAASDSASVTVGDPAVIEGNVWEDLNADGFRDPDDPAATMIVNVLDDAGDLMSFTVTDVDGHYVFDQLPPGDYTIELDLPARWEPTRQGDDSDVDTIGRSAPVTAAEGTTTVVDAGVFELATLGDYVWFDLNRDDIDDPSEPATGAATVTITELDPSLAPTAAAPIVVVADSAGFWQVDVRPGWYAVTASGPAGWAASTATVEVSSGATVVHADIALQALSSVGSVVFDDINGNGALDAGETGFEGVPVTALWAGFDDTFGTADDVTFTVISDADGRWLFDGVPPGLWRVSVADADVPAGYLPPDAVTVTVAPTESALDIELPLAPPASFVTATFTAVCVADIPYIDYQLEMIGTPAATATLTLTASTNPSATLTHSGMPLSGRILYPGASEAPDWPGWKLDGGVWVTDDSDAFWRDGVTVTAAVNPTTSATVSYPPATAACVSPDVADDQDDTGSGTGDNTGSGSNSGSSGDSSSDGSGRYGQLPNAGSDTATLATWALLTVAAGAVLAGAARRRRAAR